MATPSKAPQPFSGIALVDVLTTGYSWQLESKEPILWSVSNGFDGEYWVNPADIINEMDQLFDLLELYIDVDFVYAGFFQDPELAYAGGADINVSIDGSFLSAGLGDQVWAIGFFPEASANYEVYPGAPGDIFININSDANFLPSYEPGSTGWALMLHEVGHALGLKHTHDDGGTGGPTIEDINLGKFDKDWFSMMSYRDDYPWDLLAFEPMSPMGFDVLALQYLYGPNTTTNAGDSVYTLPLNDTYFTLWDAGGNDLIDLSLKGQGWVVELPFDINLDSRTEKIGLAMLANEILVLSPTNLYWLVGDIENITGSKFDDELYGNELANVIFANAGDDVVSGGPGDDVLAGGEGDDQLLGGEGVDIAVYSGSKMDFSLSANGLHSYVIEDNEILNGDEGRDELAQFETLQFDDGDIVLHSKSNHLIFFHDDHTYRVVLTALDWQVADTFAQAEGGHLATIESGAERQAIVEYLEGLQLADTAPLAGNHTMLPHVWLGGAADDPASQAFAMALEGWDQGAPGDSNLVSTDHVLYSVIEWDEYIPLNGPEGLILLAGDATTGETLLAETGSVSDADGLGEFSYQWQRDGDDIQDATDIRYTLTADDVGSLIAVALSYRDGQGFEESLVSEARLATQASSSAYTDLIEMYVIILGRAPAQAGLDFWSSIINQGKSFDYVASEMWHSAGAREFYPATMSTEEMVVSVYNNILNRDPQDSGKQFWTEQWQNQGPVDTMLDMISALTANNSNDPVAIADKILFNAKVDVAGYLASVVDNNDIDLAAEVFDYLEAGHNVAEAVDYIDQQMMVIGQAAGLDAGDLMA